jgi:hypothetical protein
VELEQTLLAVPAVLVMMFQLGLDKLLVQHIVLAVVVVLV